MDRKHGVENVTENKEAKDEDEWVNCELNLSEQMARAQKPQATGEVQWEDGSEYEHHVREPTADLESK